MTFCEYADGANNNLGVDQVPRVPTWRPPSSRCERRSAMGIGGSLDCGAGQTGSASGIVTEIWVPAAVERTSDAFYDVWATLAFGGLATEPEEPQGVATADGMVGGAMLPTIPLSRGS